MSLRQLISVCSVTILGLVLASGPAAAQSTSNFLKLEGITGDSTQIGFEGAIEVLSYSWGISNSGDAVLAGGRGAGVPSFSDFSIQLVTGRALPDLFIKTALGEHIAKADFTVVQLVDGKPRERIKLEFTDVLLTAFQVSGASELPIHSVSMSYASVAITVWVQTPNGSFEKVGPQSYDRTQRR